MNPRRDMPNRRRFIALAGAAACLPALARGAEPLAVIDGMAFGSGWSVALPSGADLHGIRARVASLLGELDFAFSPWRADGVVGQFNAGRALEMPVSAEVAEVARAALAVAGASGGRFDPTVGPLVARWGFGPIREGAAPAGGWRGLVAGDRHLAKAEPGLTLDLCGIAKGHALDRMVALLADAGHDDFLIDLGGELAARGRHPSGRKWRVGIEDPRPDADGLAGTLVFDGLAVATSGNRANGYDIGRRRYSHIVDPATREPVESRLASVSVLMPAAREADGWATALMAAGAAGPALAYDLDIAALFLFREEDGLRSIATGSFARHLA